MKRVFIFVCSVLVQMTALVGCNGAEDHKTITCADVISAYEEAGYEVWHNEYTEGDFLCLVNAENDDGDTIYFTFFNSADEAEQYAKDGRWNVLLWMYSWVNGDPIWVHTEAYDTIAIQYENADTYTPFEKMK